MDLTPELALLRALTEGYIRDYDNLQGQLDLWCRAVAAESAETRPMIPARLPDITEAGKLVDRIARVADTIQRIQTTGSVTVDTMKRMLAEMGAIVARHIGKLGIDDEAKTQTVESIKREWLSIRTDPYKPGERPTTPQPADTPTGSVSSG